jgi:malonyl-CoA O-methyltransferase
LKRRFPKAQVIALDRSTGMLKLARAASSFWHPIRRVCADMHAIPLKSQSINLAFSGFLMPFSAQIDDFFAEVHRILAPRGYFTFATLGPATLGELAEAWQAAGRAAPLHPLMDLQSLGDALSRAGFGDPVLDVDRYRLTYRSLAELRRDLAGAGGRSALATRSRGLMGRTARAAIERHLVEERRDSEGRFAVTCEVIFGQAWKPGSESPIRSRRSETVIPIESLRRSR